MLCSVACSLLQEEEEGLAAWTGGSRRMGCSEEARSQLADSDAVENNSGAEL